MQKKIVRKIRSYKRGRLPSLGFWLGLLLAQGAPLGLFVHLYFFGAHQSDDFMSHVSTSWSTYFSIYLYVWIGTSLYFSLFGWLTGKFMGNWLKDLQRSESSLSLFSKFDQLNRKMASSIQTQVRNPVASLLEFQEDLVRGFFGTFTPEQHETIKNFLQDIVDLHTNFDRSSERSEQHSSSLGFLTTLGKLFHAKVKFDAEEISVNFEKTLLEAAFLEILTEMAIPNRQKIQVRISQIPSQSHHDPGYALIEFEYHKKIAAGPSWLIANFIFEWHGAVLSETEKGHRLLIPLAEQHKKKEFAA